MVTVILSLLGANGDEIVFDDLGDFILTNAIAGMGIPTTQVVFADSASDGVSWRNSKRTTRDVVLPVMIFGDDRGRVEANMRRLANVLSDRAGSVTLRASYSTGEVWQLEDGHYLSGAETILGDTGGRNWARWPISMRFANPYWVRENSESVSISGGGGSGTIIPRLSELQISESQVTGSITVENEGDVDAFPVWKFRGPADSVQITSAEGLSFIYNAPISSGATVTIDSARGTVEDESGTNLYSNLGPSPKLFRLPAGATDVSINVLGSDANTVISLYYKPRKEVVY